MTDITVAGHGHEAVSAFYQLDNITAQPAVEKQTTIWLPVDSAICECRKQRRESTPYTNLRSNPDQDAIC